MCVWLYNYLGGPRESSQYPQVYNTETCMARLCSYPTHCQAPTEALMVSDQALH